MKFESFNGTREVGKEVGHFDKAKRTTVSEGSRRDANNDPARRVSDKSYQDQLAEAVAKVQLNECEARTIRDEMEFEKKANLAARRPLHDWIPREQQYLEQLRVLGLEKIDLQRKIATLKPLAQRERDREYRDRDGSFTQLAEQTALLKECRDLLQKLVRVWNA